MQTAAYSPIKVELKRLARPLYRAVRNAATYVPRQIVGSVTHVATAQPLVALTFDDGPDPRSTPALLDVLARYGAHATFFMIGSAAQRHPDLVDAIVASGHAIGCHSWDHKAFTALSHRERLAQLQACERIPVFAKHKLFRPPYGCQNLASRIDLLREGWTPVIWNITGTDWRDDPADAIVARIAEQLVPGSIVLLHDALHDVERAEYAAREPMLQAVAQLLERFCDRYRFITVPELMRAGRAQRALWWFDVGADYLAKLQQGDSSYSNPRANNYDNESTAVHRQ